jgi:transcriptional regulator with XRE-family HTH domain
VRNTTQGIIKTRTAAGLSRPELARRLGVSRESVRQLEQDHRRPSAIEAAAYRLAASTSLDAYTATAAPIRERIRHTEERIAWLERELLGLNGHCPLELPVSTGNGRVVEVGRG